MSADHLAAAVTLRAAYGGSVVAPLRGVLEPTDIEGAYAVQSINTEYWKAQGRIGPCASTARRSRLAMPGSIQAFCATRKRLQPNTASTPARSWSNLDGAKWLAGKKT